ncbi:hypothetical protein NLO74_22210 [Pseudomonas tremae]|uniref:hypothetical protein n=1 Tax=Pseudomonas tremae TaxID=200454 RepID=UPI00210D9287|nr:hypothetical protein [Pseudomonas tremae]MCQ3028705.1 hypothetical protein [Pseudomonas tremae]
MSSVPFTRSSSGHKLGQVVGDWFEETIAEALLHSVASTLGLYLDHRFKARKSRNGKIVWSDLDGNGVDYDFVLELGGTDDKQGIPLAFFETFWRRGARHSKDKARDDSGKLVPMRDTYPTARVLGIISAGDFTQPAQELVRSRGIDLFYIPKNNICRAWADCGISIDYADSASEQEKSRIADHASSLLTKEKKLAIADRLVEIVGRPVLDSYIYRIIAGVAALPVKFQITSYLIGEPSIFDTPEDAKEFLLREYAHASPEGMTHLFNYEVIFSDGNMFDRRHLSPSQALDLHLSVCKVADFFQDYHAKNRASLA